MLYWNRFPVVLNILIFFRDMSLQLDKCLKLFFLDEADDDDDPEYNFLEDLDEPDTEDFRTDRAVRITSESVCVMSPALDFSTSSFVYFAEF